jgi:hypothetical protein
MFICSIFCENSLAKRKAVWYNEKNPLYKGEKQMKNKLTIKRLLSLALLSCLAFTLCACPGGAPVTPPAGGCTHEGGTATCTAQAVCTKCGAAYGSVAAHSYVDGACTTCGAADPSGLPVPDVYADGAPIEGAGATIPEGSTCLTPTTYDESTAEEINAIAFFRSVDRQPGKVYRIADGKTLSISNAASSFYDGNGAILIAPNGMVIENGHDIELANITIVGSVTILGASNVSLEGVEIISTETALTVDGETRGLTIQNCRLTGKTALATATPDAVVIHSYFAFTEKGIVDTAKTGTTVRSCVLEGNGTGIYTTASESAYRSNTLTMAAADTGIVVEGNALNVLVALNDITGAQKSIALGGSKNVSVVLNRGVSVEVIGNKDIYIIDNSLGGRITAKNNNYFIADGNTFPSDEWNHATLQSGNTNQVGNSLMDVTARPEVGADEALLPHVDKDLFIGMERKELVKDLFDEKQRSIDSYIVEHADTDPYVIVAPGKYAALGCMNFRARHQDSTIYAYGVYAEHPASAPNSMMMNFQDCVNIVIKGLTVGHELQSCGQVYVLEKLGGNQLRVVTGAGMMNEFGNTNTRYYDTTGMGAQRMGTFYAYCDTGFNSIVSKNNKVEGVDTMIMNVSSSVYNMLAVGDILTCRSSNNNTNVGLSTCKNVVFYDFVHYGTASAFAFVENYNYTATTYYRVLDTTKSGPIISEELYNQYKALEEKYGVNLEVYQDDLGRYRGSLPHIGSIDATHTTDCGEGSKATFCLFENMCDDATNQNHFAARLHDVKDNGDGTTTITYKGVLSVHKTDNNDYSPSYLCANFAIGDRVYIYTAAGQLLADTPALTATKILPNIKTNDYGREQSVPMRSVTIKTEAINTAPLKDYDLSLNTNTNDQKVLIDNMSQASNGFVFDNCKFQNIRSRGLLIKSSEGKILNCTFRNIGMSCGAILYEIYWGESGVTENMLIDRNLFDHTGYFNNIDLYATVSITGLGSSVEEDYLCYKNIVISNNKIINRTTDYAVYVNSAKDIKILNNDFGPFVGNNFTNHPEEPDSPEFPRPLIHINGAMNVEISGNKYPNPDVAGMDYVVAERNKNVYGSDVSYDGTVDGESLIPDDV